ncbi:tyrosine-type recombinase/integrase [Fusobacterium sp.]|uniref:tyrosine-type recombinase/integrase n=1 Tax=Fusobacterium sp. TaxID=68766 RepID=UPI0026083EED|nr:tyrosine-type recombinase/integrase [Fusobacterium sp.]
MEEKNYSKNYLFPGRIRKKDGYYHLIIDTVHPVTKEKIRHSESTKLKVIAETKRKSLENEKEAMYKLQLFREKWSEYHFLNLKKSNAKYIYFTDYLKDWLNSIKSGLEPNTVRNYTLNIERKIIPYFEPKKILLKELKAKDIQDFYTHCLNERKLNPNTVIRYHANIRKALQTALKQELVTSNQADLVDKPKKRKYIAKILSPDDIFEVLSFIKGTHLELPTFFSIYYGLRRSETAGLLWSNIDFKNKKITIGNSLIEGEKREIINRRKLKTKLSHRTIELIPEVEIFLLDLKKKQEHFKTVFKNSYNKKYLDNVCVKENGDIIKLNYITQKFKQITVKLGFEDIHFHCLRHSFSTNMYNGGMDMKELQAWLGHSSISTTMDTYSHLLDKKIKKSVKIVEEVMKKKNDDKDENDKNKKNHIY